MTAHKTFTCERCKGTHEKGWSDEEALAETRRIFGPAQDLGPMSLLCNNCHKEFMTWWRTLN